MPAILTNKHANHTDHLLVPTKHTPARTNPPLGSAYRFFGPTWRSPDHSNVGGTLVGTLPGYQPRPRAKHCKRCIECGGGYALASTCKGRGGKQHCQHFNAQGQSIIATKKRNSPTCQNCKAHGDIINCDSCPGRLGVSKCINHPLDGKTPQPRKKRKTNNVNCSM